MSQSNYIILTGYVTAEPKLGHTKMSMTPVAKIRVGQTPRWLDRSTGEWRDGETSYFNVKCWRKLAENVAASLRKGDMILVRGRFRTRTWVDDKQHTRVELEIEAESVGHDMAFGWSHFNRGVHMTPEQRQRLADGEAARQDQAPDDDLDEDGEFVDAPDGLDAPDAPDGYGGYGGESAEDSAFGELTREFGQPAEEPASV